MKHWFSSLLELVRETLKPTSAERLRAPEANRQFRPRLDVLEDRTVPTTFSSIASNFNGTAIPAGDSIWFNAAFKANNLSAGPVSVHVTNQAVTFSVNGTSYNVAVPDSIINFSSANTLATTSFDGSQNAWVTNLPMNWSGNAFLGGATFSAVNGLPGGANPVTWSGNFATDTAGVSLNWQWAAAVYTNFSNDYSALGVKPVDDNHLSQYQNSDHAGTPENYTIPGNLPGGARGGGGSNWTGSYSGTGSVTPAVTNFTPQTGSLSGFVYSDLGTGSQPTGLGGVTLTLTVATSSGQQFVATATTNGSGYYTFGNLLPGIYTITETLPYHFTPESVSAGTDNGAMDGSTDSTLLDISSINLNAGDAGINYNFTNLKVIMV